MKNSSFYSDGPFHEAREASNDFGMGLYFAYCLRTTMDKFTELEREYAEALTSRDAETIAEKRSELNFYENVIMLSTQFASAPTSLTGALGD